MKIFSLMDRRNNVRILTVLGVMLMSSVRLMADSFTIDGINYSTTSDTEVTVTGGSVTGALDIPATVTNGEKQYAVTSIGSGAFYSNHNITSVHIPGSVKTIGSSAFYDNYYMSSIVIDEGVEKIESSAFGYNGNSRGANSCSLSLPNSITQIGDYAFQNNGCFNIITLDLPESLSFIGQGAFRNCSSNLEEIIIHGSVTNIGNIAFGELSGGKLTSVWVLTSTIPDTSRGDPFGGYQSNATLYVPSSLMESFQSADYWKDFTNKESLTDPIIRIDKRTWQIHIECINNQSSKIYYTTDGTEPTESSTQYSAPFKYDGAFSVVKAIAVSATSGNSEVSTLIIDKSKLVTQMPVVTMSSDFTVTMECPLPGAKIYYNFDGYTWSSEDYKISQSTLYNGPFALPYGTYVYVEAIANGYAPSGWTAVDYRTNYYVETPTISSEQVIDETYRTVKSKTVTIDYHPNNTYGGTGAYYTIDGSDPNTSATRVEYTGPFTVDRNCTVRAVAFKEGRLNSQIEEHPISDVDSQFKVDGIYYNKAENTIGNCVEVTAGGLPYTGDIVIPETVTDADEITYTVVRIGRNAFNHSNGHDIKSISLPATIESIGEYAFYDCDSITSITLPSGVKSIERYAFYDCNNLEDINLGESLVNIGEWAFAYCSKLTSLSLPATLQEIESQAFCDCDGLTSIELPNAIHTIGSSAFAYCDNLSTITMPSSLTSIGEYAFKQCNRLTSIAIPEGVTVIPSYCFEYCRSLASVTLPSTLQEIKNYAFHECDALTTIDLPDAVRTLGNYAICNCSNLISVSMPNALTSMGYNVFESCDKLTSIAIPEGVTVIPSSAFYNCSSLASVSLPSNVQSIGGQAFYRCSNLTSINLPASLTSLDYNVFEQCQKLTSIVIPDGVTVIPSSAFNNCSSLASVTLPATLKTINSSAFQNCSSLNSIILPASLTEIYENAFNGCSALTSVYSYAINPPLILNTPHAFTGVLTNANLYVNSEEAVNTYKGAKIWQDFLSVGTVGVLPCTFQLNGYTLSISSQTNGASIHYTRDGSEPTASSTLYEEPIDFLVSDTIRAIAVKEGLGNSPVAEFRQELKVERPQVSIDKDLIITITSEKPSEKLADVRYYYSCSEDRWNWPELYSKPEDVIANCTLYTEPLHPEQPGLMRVYALRDGWIMSDRTDLDYYNDYYLSAPGFNWDSNTRQLTITHSTDGVTIYYTLDGTDPGTSDSRIAYSGALTMNRNLRVRAIACMPGKFNSTIAERTVSDVSFQFEVNGLWYRFKDNTTDREVILVRPSEEGATYSGEVVVPASITVNEAGVEDEDGTAYTVTGMVDGIFRDYTSLTSVTLPATLTAIPNSAFNGCSGLTSVNITRNVTTIGEYAFYGCTSLNMNLTFGPELMSIGDYAFQNVPLGSLLIEALPATEHDKFTLLDDWTSTNHDYNSSSETTYNFEAAAGTVLSFDWSVSSEGGCDVLRAYIDGNEVLSESGENASHFSRTLTGSGSHTLLVRYSKDGSVDYGRDEGAISNVAVGKEDPVLSIGSYAFYYTALKTVDIRRTDVSINSEAFRNCSQLETVNLDTRFVQNWFRQTGSLKNVSFGSHVETIGSQAFSSCNGLTSVHIPGSIKTIGESAFYDNYNLKEIVIDEGVESIGSYAFGYSGNSLGANSCTLSLPNSITQIGDYAFQNNGCLNIQVLDLPESLTAIGSYAFQNCSSKLKQVIIHDKVTGIGSNAFNGLNNLEIVGVLTSNVPATDSGNAFGNSASHATLFAISSLLETYQSDDNWKSFAGYESYLNPIIRFDTDTWQISMECINRGAVLRYTTDGTEPTGSSTVYTAPFRYDGSASEIKAIAVCEGFENSEVKTLTFNKSSVAVPKPAVTMSEDFTVTMECTLPGAKIYYQYNDYSWQDENTRIAQSTLYEGPFTLPYGTHLYVEAVADGYSGSGWIDVNYYDSYFVESPYISSEQVIDETYRTVKSRTVTIDYHPNNTYGGTGAYYTIDGSDPNTSSTRVEYTGPFTVDRNCTVRAVAYKDGRINSQISDHSIDDVDSQFKVDGIYYNLAENTVGNYVEVTAGGLSYKGDIVIPETVTDAAGTTYTVIRIGRNAFNRSNGHNIRSITLPATIESIGEYAFNDCDSLKSVTLPKSVKSIERYAFQDCNNLADITLGESLVSIGDWAFCYCYKLAGLSLPPTVQTIGSYAFYNCDGLTAVTLPSSLTSMGNNVFEGCDNLTSVTIPEGVTVIPSSAFDYCYQLASASLPSTVQTIGNYAFRNCDGLTAVTLPSSLTSMGNNVFESCDNLTSVVIPEGITVIPSNTFYNCNRLSSVTLPSTLNEIKHDAFYNCDGLTAITLPDAVRTIEYNAFWECSNLTSITLPAALTSMGISVFQSCSSLSSIVIPDGVTDIPSSAFYDCRSLASVSFPSTLKTINSNAFYNCSSLNTVILPASLTEIYENAFKGCSSLTSVYSYATVPPAVLNTPHAFSGVLENAKLYTNSDVVSAYKDARIWQDFLSIEPIGVLPCTFAFNNDYTLSMSSQTDGASIYYTRGGSEPTASDSLYTGPIDFLTNDTIRAIVIKEGLGTSPVTSFIKNDLKAERPVVTIDENLVITVTSVKPSEKLADVRYYYSCSEDRWNWPELYSKPEDVIANCTLYTGPVHPLQSGRMRVYALRDGWMMSETDFDYSSDAYYTASPNINASYNGSNYEVTISHNTEGVVIYYTLDGTDPNTSDSRKVYTEPIILATNTRILAVATLKDHFNSSVSEYSNGRWYSFEQNGIYYRITGDTEVTVSGGSATGALDIPEKVSYGEKQYAVTSIMNDAFSYNNNITSVHIPGSVKTIGSSAFYDNYYMSSIVIDEGVERIEYNAFGYNGNSLGANSCSLSLPNSITYIDSYAFQNNGHLNITTLDLPDSLTYIGYDAFRQCSSNVTEIVIKGKVESIGNNAFGYLNNLKSVYVLTPQIPKTDEGDPFNGGQSNVTLYASPSLLESYKTADYWKSFGGYESYTNPVIRFNTDIWQISMACYNPDSKIYYTTDGTEPSDSSSLYTAPFKYDGNISVIKAVAVCNGENSDVITLTIDKAFVPTPKPTVSLSSDFKVTMECPMPGAKIYYQYNDYSWQDENTRIAQSTLYDGPFTLTYGTHIYVEAIADGYAGSGWSDINYYSGYYVSQPDILFEKAADSKSGKVTIDYHPDWSDGGSEAYYTLDGSDPSTSPTQIKYDTPFIVDRNCTVRAVAYKEGRLYSQIREYQCRDIDSQFKVDGIYYNLAENTIGNAIEVTHGALPYVGDIVIPETVTKEDGTQFTVVRIGNNAFSRNNGNEITSISLPATIQSIGDNAFYDCDKLVSIVLPDGVKSIGREAFSNCYNLEDISLGTSLEYLGENAFVSCSKLLSIKLPDTLKSLAFGIFQNCNTLTSIAIPEGITVIPSYLFSGCSNLTNVSMPSTLKTIESNAFNNCKNLTSIILPASLTSIYNEVFKDCSSLKSVYSLASVPPELRNDPHAFISILTKATLYVNSEAVSGYKGKKIWQDFLSVKPIDQIPCNPPTFSCENFIMTISCSTPGAVIYYTVDGTDPSKSATRIQYTEPFEFALNGVPLYAIATKDGMKDSDKSVYSRNLVVSNPVIYRDGLKLTITTQTTDAKIYYVVRKNRFEPEWNHDSEGRFNSYDHNAMFGEFRLYEGVTTIPYAGTVYAIAKRDGWGDSECMYLDTGDGMTLNPPTISSDEKTRLVTITLNNDDLDDVKCYYTLNGDDPNYSSVRQLYEKPFAIDRNYNIQAIVTKEDYFNSSITTKAINWFQTSKPEIKIAVQPDENKVMAEIICNGENDSIFYSTSASVDKKSPVYKEPFELTSSSATISAIAVRDGWKDSEKASFTYRKSDYTCKTPAFTENKKDSTLSISSSEGANIYYTVDGSTPSRKSLLYNAPIKIEHNQTVRAIAFRSDLLTSATGEYSISWVALNSPRIVINGNICTITSDKPGAIIRYALSDNHLSDTQIDYQVYSGPFQLSKKQTDIGAYATLTSYNDSEVAWKTFTPGEDAACKKPQVIRDGYTDFVIMNSSTDNAVIYYTLNGLDPDTKSDVYSDPIPVSSNVTVKAMSTAYGYFDSDITTFNVDWFTLPMPEISVEGNYAVISCPVADVTIYYTLDGSNPTNKSAKYTEPILLTGNVEIRAMAVLKDWNDSEVSVFTPNSFVCDEVKFDYDGCYLILSTDGGCTIHYTIDGSEPTENSMTYTEPIEISDFITVKAMSTKPFYADSPVSAYEITFISDGEDATINCKAGQLQKVINQTGGADGLTSLTISGRMNQADVAYIRTIESLEHLNLTDATVDEYGFQDNAFEGMNLISFISPKSHVKVGEHIFQDCDELAAIVWNMDESVPENLLADTDNPNLLLYVNASTYKPKNYSGNLISGGQANEILLVDTETGGNFYCPQRFYVKKISFTRCFEQATEIGITQGWETIALPFDVKTITHESKGVLAPFARGLDKDEFKPFWLCELTSTGFIDASEIKAYTPYLICMPNNPIYADDYILSGKITFSSDDIYIDENQNNASIKGSVEFTPSLQRRAAAMNIMNINLEDFTDEFGDYHRTGSVFVSGLRETRPFEASAIINVTLSSLRIDIITNGLATDIQTTYSDELPLKSSIGIFDTDGHKLDIDDLNRLRLLIDTEKIYIVNGRKVLVTPLR